jgi:tRNA (cmo5U34)-methyltransferase
MTNFFSGPVPEFDDHIRKSIPTVDAMYALCHTLTKAMTQPDTRVVDLGCSTNKFLRDTYKRRDVHYIGVDFLDWDNKSEGITFRNEDAFKFVQDGGTVDASVVLALFTLQFMPFSMREAMISRIAKNLISGGIFILAEKVHLPSAGVSEVVERSLIQWKRQSFTDAEILDKSATLAGSMRRDTFESLYQVMNHYFDTVNVIWANGAFVCMVGTKA